MWMAGSGSRLRPCRAGRSIPNDRPLPRRLRWTHGMRGSAMARFSRDEIERALEHYRDTMDRAPVDGDWSAWLDEAMTDDAVFVGRRVPPYRLEGREAMRAGLDPM